MTWVVPLGLGSLAIAVMVVFTMLSARKRARAHVAPAAVVGPRILVHDINDDRCTGCDACVAVCPTNVLDLVDNKSRVLRFEDCIQCEACMFACPTEALVMFPEGTTPPPLKIPEIDDNFQTAIPGQYLIGEVAGKPLVKNAANLGRAVIEHMLATGLRTGAIGRGATTVDVAIVGSGPGGLSAALTCIQKKLTYVVLEKEQLIASTIARYPKGKLVMAEPYDTTNLSLLPVFDAAKEQLIPIWKELMDRVGVQVSQGESVESVTPGKDGFEIKTTVAAYRAQRVVLSIGTRGKPRTLQVPGENLPKIFSLLEDPDEWRGRSVLVVGGGDSACEAALALADAGAKVLISYRGKGFNRAAPKNKTAIEAYAAEGRVKAKLGSQVLGFEGDSVALAMADGTQKKYPNDAAFVLIGADPPIAWLEKLGVKFVDRPHQHQLGKTDDVVRRFVARAVECPEDAARAAAQVLGGAIGPAPAAAQPTQAAATVGFGSPPAMPPGSNNEGHVSGPRKWLRSATSLFAPGRASTNGMLPPPPSAKVEAKQVKSPKKFEVPVPLSEFAKRGKSQSTQHTGHGRRDALSAGERTRILRMLRDEGGRMADEDSQVHIGAAPSAQAYDFDFDDEGAAPVAPPVVAAPLQMRDDMPAKPAVVVGLAQAAAARRTKRTAASMQSQSNAQQPPFPEPVRKRPTAPPPAAAAPPVHSSQSSKRLPVPKPFGDEPTRQVDDKLLASLRSQPAPQSAPSPTPKFAMPKAGMPKPGPFDEPTRLAEIDASALDDASLDSLDNFEGSTRLQHEHPFLIDTPTTDVNASLPRRIPEAPMREEATRIASVDSIAAAERKRLERGDAPARPERQRNDKSISDIDWDLD